MACKRKWYKDLETGEWVHITIAHEDKEELIYINGVLKYKI